MQAETQRQVEHMIPVAFAVLLRWLPLWLAAALAALSVVYGVVVSPRIFRRTLREDELPLGFSPGKFTYGAVVLALIMIFRESGFHVVAGAWALMGIGDGMSNIVGRRFGRSKVAWNRDKSWEGAAAFVVFGALAAGLLIWLTSGSHGIPQLSLVESLLVALVAAIPAALVETLPNRWVDDNITVPVVGALVLCVLTLTGNALDKVLSVFLALSLNFVLGYAAWRARAVDQTGLIAGLAIGAIVALTLALPGWLVLAAMFALGTAATRWKYESKRAAGIAQESGGQRGWIHATAKCAVACACAVGAWLGYAQLNPGLMLLGFVAALATAAMDTVSSELGPLYGRVTMLPPTFRRVKPGTPGAVSLEGTLLGLAGAAVVAALAAALGLLPGRLAWVPIAAAFVGTTVESLLGSAGLGRTSVSSAWLNFVNTAVGAAVAILLGGVV
jgi:uncharacterized protein (TIGR00297 family)